MAFTQVYIDTIVKSHSKYNWSEHGVVLSYYNLNSIDYQSIGIYNKDSILTKYSAKKHELYFGNNPLDLYKIIVGDEFFTFDPIDPVYQVERSNVLNGFEMLSEIGQDFWSKDGSIWKIEVYNNIDNCLSVITLDYPTSKKWVPENIGKISKINFSLKNRFDEELTMRFIVTP